MVATREYADEPSGPFPRPPDSFEDGDGRTIELVAPTEVDEEVLEDLVAMYDAFDPVDRAQGIPPTGEQRIRNWLESIVDIGTNVIASHEGDVVGHATLVPDSDDAAAIEAASDIEWELAIFVLQDYQRAGIGTQLLEHLLGHAAEVGIERVWLTVERWNGAAIALYERVGFEQTGGESFEQEMTIRLE
ncbi:GNAT family N-acetyltransferase [Halostagnicola kamekurae]|uniref:Acetyltransferase (GNAT) family protein n=1 Tax=Halostagnicola kamekurae TaxID=619731 RepID=A0A1I6PJL9_9EURY|nr:GNAT family N-acetyltransferase [Halostagnicola kamekurae]SFS40235.1 Acetyltransferase (GNAT) family protein [Halostagnicola kamekurae]